MGLQKVRYDRAKSKLLQRSKFMKKRNDTVKIHCHYGDQNLERLSSYYLLFSRDFPARTFYKAFSSPHSWLQESPFTDSHIPHVTSTKDWNPGSVHWGGACFSCNYGLLVTNCFFPISTVLYVAIGFLCFAVLFLFVVILFISIAVIRLKKILR